MVYISISFITFRVFLSDESEVKTSKIVYDMCKVA